MILNFFLKKVREKILICSSNKPVSGLKLFLWTMQWRHLSFLDSIFSYQCSLLWRLKRSLSCISKANISNYLPNGFVCPAFSPYFPPPSSSFKKKNLLLAYPNYEILVEAENCNTWSWSTGIRVLSKHLLDWRWAGTFLAFQPLAARISLELLMEPYIHRLVEKILCVIGNSPPEKNRDESHREHEREACHPFPFAVYHFSLFA